MDDANLTEAQRQAKGLGKGRGLAERAAATASGVNAPDPSERFSYFWNRDDAATRGYASTRGYKADREAGNLPYQRGAPGGAAGPASSTDCVGPAGPGGLPVDTELIEQRLGCNAPSAISNLWACHHCSSDLKRTIWYDKPSKYKGCYDDHKRYCGSRGLRGWER